MSINTFCKDNRDRIGQGPNIYQAQHLYNGNCSNSNIIATILAECTNRVLTEDVEYGVQHELWQPVQFHKL